MSVISLIVILTVVVLSSKILPRPEVIPSFVKYQPLLHASINGICSILLLLSLYFIKKKNISAHKSINLFTFFLSAIFLVSYIAYHYLSEATTFPKENSLRPVYLFILSSHIILAALVFPMILLSFYWGLKNEVKKHKKLVRWTFPIWLYVTITGVVVYVMISPYYQFQ